MVELGAEIVKLLSLVSKARIFPPASRARTRTLTCEEESPSGMFHVADLAEEDAVTMFTKFAPPSVEYAVQK
jgi:hypothetical protein